MPKKRLYQILKDANIGDTIEDTKQIIRSGQVKIDGKVCTLPHFQLDPKKKKVTYQDKKVKQLQKHYFILHKPKGYTCQKNERLPFVGKLIPFDVNPIGRLDVPSTGLLLMTNDGELTSLILSPNSKVPKTYAVEVGWHVRPEHLTKLRSGVLIDVKGKKYKTRPCRVKRTSAKSMNITIMEGKKRQIRLMLKSLGLKVKKLHRISIGNIRLGKLRPGKSKRITKEEILKKVKVVKS